jgi:hypothetical protein
MDEKISLLEKYGIDHLVVVPFTEAFANQSAEDYISISWSIPFILIPSSSVMTTGLGKDAAAIFNCWKTRHLNMDTK